MSQPIKLLVGLANPGPEYTRTRHNAGAWVVEELARNHNVLLKNDSKFFGLTGRIMIDGQDLRLLIPTTYMNLSGKSVAAMAKFYQIKPEEIMIAHDELDLPPGIAKFKKGGGHGGHNGLKDIQEKLNTQQYNRFRFGIGGNYPRGRQADFVLGSWTKEEKSQLIERIPVATKAILSFGTDGINNTMNRFNGK